MPDHVTNEIIIHDAKLEDVRKHLFTKEDCLSFEVLLPLPLNYWAGSVGFQHEQAFPGNHLAAARAAWGTKWDAYGYPTAEDTEAGVKIRFDTAYNHPRGWVCALFNTVKRDMTARWICECDDSAHVEIYVAEDFNGGASWVDHKLTVGSPEYRQLLTHMYGYDCSSEAYRDE